MAGGIGLGKVGRLLQVLSRIPQTARIIDALQMSRLHGHLQPNAICHSDRGRQYASGECATHCAPIGVRRSMCRTEVCWDDAGAETFLATMRNEMYYRYVFATKARARSAVAEFIEVFYNRKRMRFSIGFRTPAQALYDYRSAALAV